jgi:hypothetical protein
MINVSGGPKGKRKGKGNNLSDLISKLRRWFMEYNSKSCQKVKYNKRTLIYSPVVQHLGRFHNLAVVNNAAINIRCLYCTLT